MARAEDDPAAARRAFLATGVSVWVCWNAGTLAGALLGGGLGDPRALGLDAMFPAAFLALLAPQLRRPGAPVAAVAGALVAVALLPFAPAGVPVVAALAGVVPGVLVRARRAGMSWAALLALCAVSYALKAVGPGARRRPASSGRRPAGALDLVAVPLLAALILTQTLGGGQRLVARRAGAGARRRRRARLAAGAVPRRRARAAAGTAALLRALG